MPSHHFASITLAMICLSALSGCGAPSSTVSGKILVDGQAPRGGLVTFSQQGRSFSGIVDGEGRFTLQTTAAAPLLPGEYTVTLTPPKPKTEIDPVTTEIRALEKIDESLYPPLYRVSATTPLKQTIVAGEQEVTLTVSRK